MEEVFDGKMFRMIRDAQNMSPDGQRDLAALMDAEEVVENAQEQLEKAKSDRYILVTRLAAKSSNPAAWEHLLIEFAPEEGNTLPKGHDGGSGQ